MCTYILSLLYYPPFIFFGMKYIFEDIIDFDVEGCSLTHVETNDHIPLASICVNLLEYFIQNQGTVINRNRLLEDIFKKAIE